MPTINVTFNNEQIMNRGLNKDVYVIGRHEDCDIHIDNLGISRTHARLIKEGASYVVEDMNSSNGTFVNGEKTDRKLLADGDQIVIGKYLLIYSMENTGADMGESNSDKATVSQMPGDVLHTMAMDGDAIRKRIEEMQQKKETHPMPAPKEQPEEKAPEADPIQQAEIKAKQAELEQLKARMKVVKIIAGLAILAAAAAAVYFFVLR